MIQNRERLPLHSDIPAQDDFLGFDTYRDALIAVISDLDPEATLTIGIYGPWGSGKTTLLKMISRKLSDPVAMHEHGMEPIPTVWVNAWKLGTQDEIWNAFIQALLTEIRSKTPRLKRIRFDARLFSERINLGKVSRQILANIYRVILSITPIVISWVLPSNTDLDVAVKNAAPLLSGALAGWTMLKPLVEASRDAISLDLGVLLKDSPFEEQVATIVHLRSHFEKLVKAWVGEVGHLAVIIDDLDRCPPGRITQVLDAVKLFIDVPRCIYLLGLDRSVIEQAVALKYSLYADSGSQAREYLEKIIQLPFDLPPLTRHTMEGYVDHLSPRLPGDHKQCSRVFSLGLELNPRKIKRTINIFTLLWQLAQQREELRPTVKPVRLAKITVIQYSHRDFYDHLVKWPEDLAEIEIHFRNIEKTDSDTIDRGELVMKLLDVINERFDLDELRSLCFELGVDIENLGGETKAAKARELLNFCAKRERLLELTEQLLTNRPDLENEIPTTYRAALEGKLPERLTPFLGKPALLNLLTMHSSTETDTNFASEDADGQLIAMPASEIRSYITLTELVAVPAETTQELTVGLPSQIEPDATSGS